LSKKTFRVHSGIDITVETTTKVVITLSSGRAECIAHQIGEALELRDDEEDWVDMQDLEESIHKALP
jgi:hypothetical protein